MKIKLTDEMINRYLAEYCTSIFIPTCKICGTSEMRIYDDNSMGCYICHPCLIADIYNDEGYKAELLEDIEHGKTHTDN